MRIIGGRLGGRRIRPPANMPHTRPTTDIAKEGLFNILQNSYGIDGADTLDLFGGTGCISYELASRGASWWFRGEAWRSGSGSSTIGG